MDRLPNFEERKKIDEGYDHIKEKEIPELLEILAKFNEICRECKVSLCIDCVNGDDKYATLGSVHNYTIDIKDNLITLIKRAPWLVKTKWILAI